jgi:ABC-type sugar transport system permease subunit
MRCLIAEVKAPFSCPKSSLSISSDGIAAQFTSMNGLLALGEFWYIAIPLILPFYATMALLNITGILDAGSATLLLTGGAYGTYDIPFYLYKYTVSGTLNDQGLAGAIGLLKGLIVLPIALGVNSLVNKIETVEY